MTNQLNNIKKYGNISWGAIAAGALTAAAFTIILSVLGSGLGLTIVSPWSTAGVSAATFGISAILWLSITQIVASGMGGFLAGRLRDKYDNLHADDVYFRDTAHGFLTWAIALIVTVSLFASVLGSIVNSGMESINTMASSSQMASKTKGENSTQAYYLDSLFRKDATADLEIKGIAEDRKLPLAEVSRIYAKSLQSGGIQPNDTQYLGQLVSKNTGLTQDEAEKRVNEAYTSIYNAELALKDKANQARKASAYVTLWGFIALLIGAFSASLSATWGGRCRDNQSNS